jgi:predicted dehydrogenase/aryl-alcohol dehydrogenase-like predicted oxidoreductase
MDRKLAWGIIGTGRIAHTFANGLLRSKLGRLVAVGSRTQERADKFGEEFSLPHRHGSYQALLANPEVEAVYVSTPHPMHAEWAIKAAEAGKHILCEKPIGINEAEAMAIIEAARRHHVFLMEAFMYRCHPQTAKLVELVRDKAIGEVRVIEATFSFDAGFDPEGRLFKNALGGGGILDVGCYCVSMARLIAGAAVGEDFADPIAVKAVGKLGETGVDEYALASLQFPGGVFAQVATCVRLNQENVVRIYGSQGWILVKSPWFAGAEDMVVRRWGQEEPTIIPGTGRQDLYAIEADTVAANLEKRQAPSPAMTWADTLGNMRTLDRWRQELGLVYEMEQPENVGTVSKRPLAVRRDAKMTYGRIEGVEKPVSRLVKGNESAPMPYAAVMLDDYFESGGNCFDSAYIYAGGWSDRLLGQWIRNRGIREQVVILAKNAHSPLCRPEYVKSQLMEILERMQLDYVDLLMAHRDNPEIPVGEFVEAFNELKRAGYVRAFGGSNWSVERVEAANAYAKNKGLAGFSAVSNNFSLARMVDPVWAGCIASSDPESRAWFTKTQMPLMAWSSLARGFFVWGDPNDRSHPDLARCWYSQDNFQRLARAKELAKQKGVKPVNIALAYVLSQPFPTFALIGPANLEEMSICLRGLEVELTPEELRWLNLEA